MKFLIITIVVIFSVLTYFMINKKEENTNLHTSSQVAGSDKKMEADNDQKAADNITGNLKVVNTWPMPEELLEISGLGFIDNDRVAAVQDEQGIVFTYNLKTRSIEHKANFEKQGDFEGIEVVGSTAWVVRSDGHLYEILNFSTDKSTVNQYNTSLTSKENIEGLALDKKNNRLLLSIKDKDVNDKTSKGIYAFNLETKKLDAVPAYKIELKNEFFKGKKSDQPRPSALAIDPSSGNIMVLDGPSARLLILGNDSKIKSVIALDKKQFPQAEGIAYSPEGKMYISNEGSKKNPGTI